MDKFSDYQKNSRNHTLQKKYSRITAQIAKNTVRKKIYEIKKRGRLAAEELLDTVEEMLQKSIETESKRRGNNNVSSQNVKQNESYDKSASFHTGGDQNSVIYNEIAETIAEGIALADKLRGSVGVSEEITPSELFLIMIRNDRSKWRDFICKIAEMSDPETLSCFLVNLIYGGYMTEVREGGPCVSFIEVSEAISQNSVTRLREILKKDVFIGKRVCIIRGNDIFNVSMLQIYRNFNETAFILLSKDGPRGTRSLSEQGINNVLFIPEISGNFCGQTYDRRAFSGIAVIINEEIRGTGKISGGPASAGLCSDGCETCSNDHQNVTLGQGSHTKLSYGGGRFEENPLKQLFYFLSSPNLPVKISFNDFYNILCKAESFISRNTEPDRYTI